MKKRDRQENLAETSDAAEPDEATEASPSSEATEPVDDDDWDGPTREVAPEEVAALAVKSTGDLESGEGAPAAEAPGDDDLTLPRLDPEDVTPVHEDSGALAAAGEALEGEGAPGQEPQGDAPEGEPAAADDAPAADSESEASGAVPDDGAAPGRLESVIESLLFVSDRPLTINDLKRLTGERQAAKLTAAVEALQARREESGIQLVSVAGGWHLRTHPENVAWVSRLVAGKPVRLSRAMLETLAIVAYRQPVTRPEIDEIRGVDCGPVLGTLLDRGLIRIIGKKEEVGRPMLYGTTPEFLRTFSLRDLNELPTLREFHELSEAHRDEVAKVDAERGPAEGDVTEVQAAPPRRPAPARPLDPEEDDGLLEELERASAAAAAATAEPQPATPEAPMPEPVAPPVPVTSDEPVGGAE